LAVLFVARLVAWYSLGSFREIAVKNCEIVKSSKIGRQVCAQHFVKKNPPQYFTARKVNVHLYKCFFFRILLYSASSNCQISYRESKNGSERTQFARIKSHIGSKFSKIFFGSWGVVYRR